MDYLVTALTCNATTLFRLHPDEYLFFNPLVGGLEGASRRYATDYWVNIMPEAVADLEKYLDQNGQPIGKRPLQHYSVAVCGERLPFEKAADARLQYTRDWRHADFFIAPTHMSCDRALDGRTAGDAGLGIGTGGRKRPYYLARENGANAAIRFMADADTAPGEQIAGATTFNGHAVYRVSYLNTVGYFLRVLAPGRKRRARCRGWLNGLSRLG